MKHGTFSAGHSLKKHGLAGTRASSVSETSLHHTVGLETATPKSLSSNDYPPAYEASDSRHCSRLRRYCLHCCTHSRSRKATDNELQVMEKENSCVY
ncbi:unnamed protein product [Dibothriocephalus latus]|uniref:Uncharacterized protein n=1 Tax=Dibothriocephalus latus TaxID=60516 RepID=A0A3P7P627_DIBLA|nr:unnamed protein product [Dibothriocephalus latus]